MTEEEKAAVFKEIHDLQAMIKVMEEAIKDLWKEIDIIKARLKREAIR